MVTYACETWVLKENKNQTKGIWEEGTKKKSMDPLKKRMAHGGLNRMKN